MIRLLRALDWKVYRLRVQWRLWRAAGDEAKRRNQVENFLWAAAAGKKPLPDAEKCRELARKLGIPSEYQ